MKVPLLDLRHSTRQLRLKSNGAVAEVMESQHFILGPQVQACEKAIAEYSRCAHGVGVSSGTDALLICLMAEGIGPGDEVITTPYTFFATAGSIARVGAKPVFVDIDPVSYNLNPAQISAKITAKTRAIIPVHLYGQMADMDAVMEVAQKHGLVVIEDAAQAIGAEYKGRRAGSIGHYGCFSFFPSKNLGAAGDGGMVVTNDAQTRGESDAGCARMGPSPSIITRSSAAISAWIPSRRRLFRPSCAIWMTGRRRGSEMPTDTTGYLPVRGCGSRTVRIARFLPEASLRATARLK